MKQNKLLLVIGSVLYSVMSHAQFRLPPIDIQLKSGYMVVDGMRDKYNNLYYSFSEYRCSAPLVSIEANWNFAKNFSFGGFFTKGVNATTSFKGEVGNTHATYQSGIQLYGLKFRYAMSRQHMIRPFAELTFGKFEMYLEKDAYRISTSGSTFGFSIGAMIRLRNNLYLVAPEASYNVRSEPYYFEEKNNYLFSKYPGIIQLKAGLAYHFGKRK